MKRAASLNGGAQAQWRGDSRELYYLASDNALMAVEVQVGDGLVLGVPQRLFPVPVSGSMVEWRNHYSPSEDGKRFLVRTVASVPPPLRLVANWPALLAQ